MEPSLNLAGRLAELIAAPDHPRNATNAEWRSRVEDWTPVSVEVVDKAVQELAPPGWAIGEQQRSHIASEAAVLLAGKFLALHRLTWQEGLIVASGVVDRVSRLIEAELRRRSAHEAIERE